MFARTPRLFLRPGWADDAAALAAAIGEEAIVRNLATAPWPYGVEEARAFLARPAEPGYPTFLAFARTSGPPRLIGACGLSPTPAGEIELGYWIARPHWGLGYATEAGHAVLQTARALGHARLIASHFADNPASGRVLAKLGFRPTGRVERRHSQGRGGAAASVLYALYTDRGTMRAEPLVALAA